MSNLIEVLEETRTSRTVIADENGDGKLWEKAQSLCAGGEKALLAGLTNDEYFRLIEAATQAGFLPESEIDIDEINMA